MHGILCRQLGTAALPPKPQPQHDLNQNYSINGHVVISALAILLFIVIIFLLLHILHAKQLQRRSVVDGHLSSQESLDFIPSPLPDGLDKEIVQALPVFTYKSLGLLNASDQLAVECAVCLSRFRQDETCKLLPKCKHFFHTDCINMWFFSNTTCPLCRAAITNCNSDCGEVLHGAASQLTMPCGLTKQDGADEPAECYRRGAVAAILDTRDHNIAYGRCNSNGDWKSQDNPLLQCQISIQSPITSWSYKRYKFEKFPQSSQDGVTNVSPWSNHMLMPMRMNPVHWKTGRRSFSHTTIDILRPQESIIVKVSSCPTLVLQGSPEPGSTSLPHLVHHLGGNWSF